MCKHTFTHVHPYVYQYIYMYIYMHACTYTHLYISVRTNPYPLSNRIIDKRAKVGKNSITVGPFKHQRPM